MVLDWHPRGGQQFHQATPLIEKEKTPPMPGGGVMRGMDYQE
jgi:hypothetical protein